MPARYRRRKRNSSPCDGLLLRQALLLFLLTAVLIRSGAAALLEQTVTTAGSRFEQAIIQLADPPETSTEETAPAPADPHTETDQTAWESNLPMTETPTAPLPAETIPVTIDGRSGAYDSAGGIYIKNETDYAVDVPALLAAKDPVALSGDQVQILVMHTHGTESYTPTAENNYAPTDTDRTTDCRFNVVRVGQAITDTLNAMGIRTVHSETLNDSPAYSGSYNRALEDITAYIKENPSIKLVIDVHRDAMVTASGKKYKTVAEIDGQQTAQLMLVCGTDGGGLVHDGWRDNLSFQLKIQQRLNAAYPGIMRPLNLRAARFNQHVTPGSMLLEVGTTGNTLEEALTSATLFAQELGKLLLERS